MNVDDGAAATPAAPLSAIEARILGSLIEKQATTPDAYPLTLNAVVTACNQKSNREPVSDYEPGEVGHALRELEGRGLVAGSLAARASRYAHRFDAGYHVTARQRAVLGLLLLRGPQTLNELLQRSERLAEFADAGEVREVVERLATREPALVACVGRAPGQREDRWMHLLCGPVVAVAASAPGAAPVTGHAATLAERVTRLEAIVATLEAELAAMRGETPGTIG
ncbi:MAG: YceH family protein [Xanthomonadales bacterium]|nr:YceH family protein [Xanthomonadales bacterium]